MRIRQVTITGFGPFKDTQTVDFGAFDADGLFLIGGETGAGKSTILDAIAYALYGDTPRWDDASATGAARFRSDYCEPHDPTEVVLEFEIDGAEYRLTRAPEYDRPKTRGDGTTKQAAKALLEQRIDGDWLGIADKPRDVGTRVPELVRLTKDEFLQVILLAQGRFQRFLLAPRDERLELLSKLFGAQRFADYQERIAEKRKSLKDTVEAARSEQNGLLRSITADDSLGAPSPGSELEWVGTVLAAAGEHARRTAGTLSAATTTERTAHDQLAVAERQQRKQAAEDALAALAERAAEIDAVRAVVSAAERAERVRALVDAAADAARAIDRARSAVDGARSAYAGDVTDDGLAAEVTRLDRTIGTLADALADEQRAAHVARELDTRRAEVDQLARDQAATTERIGLLAAGRGPLVEPAARVAQLRERRDSTAQRLAAAQAATAIKTDLIRAQEAQLAADQAFNTARELATRLLDRHLHAQAALLAQTLVPGEPCTVCGSREHPAPAEADDEVVGRDAVDTAQQAADQLEPAAKSARERVDDLRREEARLGGLTGDATVDALRQALDQAENDLAAATAASSRLAQIDAELDGPDGLRTRSTAHQTDLTAAATQVTTLKTTLDELRARVDALRDDYPSVAARHEALTTEHDAVKALGDALTAHTTATTNLATAREQLTAKATQEEFTSAEAAVAAMLDAETLAAHQGVVADHERDVNRARGQLDSPDLRDLPAEPVDLAEARTAASAATAGKEAALKEHATAENAVTRLTAQREQLRGLVERSAGLAAEYDVLDRLASTLNGRPPNSTGMSLESYYVAAELEAVLGAANHRLRAMTGGRYQLQHTERGILRTNAATGLELAVMDENTGKARDPHTLSGGEQFLASLALALGLAEVVTARAGGVILDTLFVDEGFGSLSPEYLEVAMATLDALKAGGRTVGVISHVDSMKESIGAQLQVVKDPGGWSRIDQPAG